MNDAQVWTTIGGMFTFMLAFVTIMVRMFGQNLDTRFDALTAVMTAGFQQVDRRFEQVDRRFEQVDARFEQVDARFDRVEHRLDRIEGRVDALDRDVTAITRRLMGPDAT
jgi:tetrahydromethanopterin S-methyltransferase subunit G